MGAGPLFDAFGGVSDLTRLLNLYISVEVKATPGSQDVHPYGPALRSTLTILNVSPSQLLEPARA